MIQSLEESGDYHLTEAELCEMSLSGRLLKSRVAMQYPEAYTKTQASLQAELDEKERLEEEEENR